MQVMEEVGPVAVRASCTSKEFLIGSTKSGAAVALSRRSRLPESPFRLPCGKAVEGYPRSIPRCCFPSIYLIESSPPPLSPALIQLRFERIAQQRGDLHSPSACSVLHHIFTILHIQISVLSFSTSPDSFPYLLTSFFTCDTHY